MFIFIKMRIKFLLFLLLAILFYVNAQGTEGQTPTSGQTGTTPNAPATDDDDDDDSSDSSNGDDQTPPPNPQPSIPPK